MTCRESAVELVECARAGERPGAELEAHLVACPRCRQRWQERWDDERRLTAHFRALREAVVGRPSPLRREQLMREFEYVQADRFRAVWRRALHAAAVLLVVVALVYGWNHRPHPNSNTQSAWDEGDFVPVPYALPLAPGELVRVVRTELDPVALAGLGVDIESADGADIPADVLLGEDGIPRAVRLLNSE